MAKRKRVSAHALAKNLQDMLNAREVELQYARAVILQQQRRIEELERDQATTTTTEIEISSDRGEANA